MTGEMRDPMSDLRDLLDQMPEIAARMDADAVTSDAEILTLKNWADRTITAAERAGRPDIVEKVRSTIRNLEDAQDRALQATLRRREAHSAAENVLRGLDPA